MHAAKLLHKRTVVLCLLASVLMHVVVYVLTRPGGLAAKRQRPLWAAATGVTRMISGAQAF